jgi:hypothetical protein
VTGGIGLIVTAVVVLLKYLPQGALYIIGGSVMALGAFVPVMELLLCVTFSNVAFVGWSFYLSSVVIGIPAPMGRDHPHQSGPRFRRAEVLTASPSREKPLGKMEKGPPERSLYK